MENFLNTLWGIVQGAPSFILLIGVLVFVHELGHFLAAKWCGMRADVFAIGMGPRLFGWNKHNGFTFGKLPADLELGDDTDFRLSVFPIGGYVKIAGMVDESMDVDFTTHKPQPWEFRSKNALQKAFVISAGVIMNFLLAIVVFSAINFFAGREARNTTTVGPLPVNGPAYAAGLRQGDRITSINGKTVETFDDVQSGIYLDEMGNDLSLLVSRPGAVATIVIPRANIKQPSSAKDRSIIPNPDSQSVVVQGVVEGSPAGRAGMQKGDTILAMDGQVIGGMEQMQDYTAANLDKELTISINRRGQRVELPVRPNETGKIGVMLENVYRGSYKQITYGIGGAIADGTGKVFTSIRLIANLIGDLFKGKASVKESLGGPGAVAKQAYESWKMGIVPFVGMLGLLSVMLGFMNILPIPALDGGHLVFIIIEAITRREVPVKVRMAVQQVGVALLLMFMIFVTYNDIFRK